MFSWQPIKKFLCNLLRTDNISMMGIKTLAISLGQSVSVAEIVLFLSDWQLSTGSWNINHRVSVTFCQCMITLLTQEACGKHPDFTTIFYLSIYTFAFPSSYQTILCEVQPPTHAKPCRSHFDAHPESTDPRLLVPTAAV